MATNGDKSEAQAILVADLAIDLETQQVDFSSSVPIESYLLNKAQVKETMHQLLDIILGFFEVETQKVENGQLKDEEMLLNTYVQEDDTNTKRSARLPPKKPCQRRA